MVQLQLSTIQDPSVEVSDALPQNWNAMVVNGSRIIHLSLQEGSCTAQQVTEQEFSIRYIVSNFMNRIRLLIPPNDMVVQVWLALKNDFVGQVRGVGKIHLKEGQFAILHAAKNAMEATLNAGKEQQVVEVSYVMPVVTELYETYPELQEFMQAVRESKAFFIGIPGLNLSHHGKDALMDVLQANFPKQERGYYDRMKIREFFYITVGQVLHKNATRLLVSREVAEKLQKLHDVLTSNFARKYSLQEMSAITGLSIYVVGEAFKKRYGMSPKMFHVVVRLEKAHDLARNTDLPFKAIAAMVGYTNDAHLHNEFRKHFRYTPGSLRGED